MKVVKNRLELFGENKSFRFYPLKSAIAVFSVFTILSLKVSAADYYWDTNGTSPGFGSASGAWGESAYWTTDPTGIAEPAAIEVTSSDTLYFGTKMNPIGGGEITVDIAAAAGNVFVCAAEGETVSFSGSGSITLADCASVIQGGLGQTVTFNIPVSSSGSCTFSPLMPADHEFYPTDGADVPNASYDTIVLRNAMLKDVKPTAAYFNKRGWGGLKASGEAEICFLSRTAEEILFQCQVHQGGYTKCVKLRLSQSGNDIVARIVYTRYYSKANEDVVGEFDFDSSKGWATYSPFPIWDADNNKFGNGYAIDYIDFAYEIQQGNEPKIVFCEKAVFGGAVTNGLGCVMSLKHPDALCENGVLSTPIYSDGVIEFAGPPRHIEFNANISGNGSILVDFVWPSGETQVIQDVLNATEWTLIAEDVPIFAITNGSAYFTGGTVDKEGTAEMYWPKYDSDTKILTMQVQHYDNSSYKYTKCVYIEIKEENGALYVRTPSTNYASGDVRGADFDKLAQHTEKPIATSETASGYCIKNVKLVYGKNNGYISLNAKMPGGVTEFFDMACDIKLTGNVTDGIFNKNGIFRIHNSTANLFVGAVFGSQNETQVQLDNSVLNNLAMRESTYLNNIVLSNASQVTGGPLRIGYHDDALIAIRGIGASSFDANIIFAQKYSGSGNRQMVFDVDDTTGDNGVDFNLNSTVTLFNTTWTKVETVKTGPGTMRMTKVYNPLQEPFYIREGAVRIGADNIFPAGGKISLDGGSLEAETDIAATAGTLILQSDGTISLDDGASLAFADSSAATWADGAILTVKGDLKKSTLSFGSSSSALSEAQQSMLVLEDGRRLTLDESGKVVPVPEALVIILR